MINFVFHRPTDEVISSKKTVNTVLPRVEVHLKSIFPNICTSQAIYLFGHKHNIEKITGKDYIIFCEYFLDKNLY